jgi:hypothetical protein
VRSETLDYRQKQGEKGRLAAEKRVAKESSGASLHGIGMLIASVEVGSV